MEMLFTCDGFGDYTVRQANEPDIKDVQSLLRNTAQVLKNKGIAQWGYLLAEDAGDNVAQDILAGHTYIVETREKSIAAGFNLSRKQNSWDAALWGKRSDDACYLHRLAVNETHRHQAVGKQLLQFISEYSCIENGYFRLDCVAGNPVLNQYYQDAGFQYKGYGYMEGEKFSKYEKRISSKA